MNKIFRARIYGLVQGVGYRYFALREARRLGIAGYVRNLADGSVEVSAQGPAAELDNFLEMLRQGPSGAQVSRVEVEWPERGESDYADFTIEF